jgi:exodeoxyribonuclease VII large subunit
MLHPAQRLQQQSQRLNELHRQMQSAIAFAAQRWQWRWLAAGQRLQVARPDLARLEERQPDLGRRLVIALQRNLDRHALRLATLQQHLQHLDPTHVLARGYSMVRDANGKIVLDSANISLGEKLDIVFAHGGVGAVVQEKRGS